MDDCKWTAFILHFSSLTDNSSALHYRPYPFTLWLLVTTFQRSDQLIRIGKYSHTHSHTNGAAIWGSISCSQTLHHLGDWTIALPIAGWPLHLSHSHPKSLRIILWTAQTSPPNSMTYCVLLLLLWLRYSSLDQTSGMTIRHCHPLRHGTSMAMIIYNVNVIYNKNILQNLLMTRAKSTLNLFFHFLF